ncbi:hypothetical protein HanRHA438_Chr09g0396171 [Helianthus annuus]|nr:hypothetical protein HanIR_Chr09g0414741 [Helianthus annuus]KAJ0887908.1 hypothetical protein HanRHA438_Chr09g0396171 [Helianthus annuus]
MALSAFGSSESNVLIIIPADLGKCSHFPRKSEYSAEVLSRSGRSISDGGIGGNPGKWMSVFISLMLSVVVL